MRHTLDGLELDRVVRPQHIGHGHGLHLLGAIDIVTQQIVNGLDALGTVHRHHVQTRLSGSRRNTGVRCLCCRVAACVGGTCRFGADHLSWFGGGNTLLGNGGGMVHQAQTVVCLVGSSTASLILQLILAVEGDNMLLTGGSILPATVGLCGGAQRLTGVGGGSGHSLDSGGHIDILRTYFTVLRCGRVGRVAVNQHGTVAYGLGSGSLGGLFQHMHHRVVALLLLEACSDKGDLHLVAQRIVGTHTPNHIRLAAAGLLGDIVRHLAHLVHRNLVFGTEGEMQQHILGALDIIVVQQHRGGSLLHGLFGALLALALADTHQGGTAVFHHRIHITEVDIHVSIQCDNLRNALHGGQQHIVSHGKGIRHHQVAVCTQLLVIDNQNRVDILAQLLNTLLSLLQPAEALEQERSGHHSNDENLSGVVAILGLEFDFLGHAGNDGSRTGAGTATHACSDEHHFRILFEQRLDLRLLLLSCLARLGGTTANTQSLVTKHQLVRHRTAFERLHVSIADDKVYTRNTFAEHVVHGIVTTASHSDNLDI